MNPYRTRLTKTILFQIGETKEFVTARAELLSVAETLKKLDLGPLLKAVFPVVGSNRGHAQSVYVNTMVMTPNEECSVFGGCTALEKGTMSVAAFWDG